MTLIDEPQAAGSSEPLAVAGTGVATTPQSLLSLNREAIRKLHLLARELDDAVHANCVHQPLARARDDLLALAVHLQIALRDLD